jgi:hypothetical protein
MKYLICEKRKTYFAYTPKSGVESLILLVLKEQGEKNITSDIWSRNTPYIRHGEVPNGYFYIVICRNPYDRLSSAYIDKFLTGNFFHLPFCKQVMDFYERSMDDERRISFEELVNFLITQPKHNIDAHFATQISTINTKQNPDILKLENIPGIVSKLKELNFDNKFDNYRHIYLYGWIKEDIKEAYKMGFNEYKIFDTFRGYPLDENEQGYKDENNNHGIMPYYENFYNDELKEKVYNFYKEDFEYFRYEK